MNKTLFRKILVMSLAIILVVSGISAVVMNFFIKQFILHSKETEMMRQGERVVKNIIHRIERNALEAEPPGPSPWVYRIVGMIRDIEGVIGGKIWLMDGDGLVYTNSVPIRQLNDHELQRMRMGRRVSKFDWSDELNKPVLAVAIPVTVNGEMIGGVFMITPMKEVYNAQSNIRRIILISALIGVLVALIFAYWFSRHLTKPVLDMQRLIKEMRQGDFSGQLEVKRDDELGQLAKHFNYLNQELQETILLLSTEKEKTQRIIHSMAEGVISLNSEGEIVLINPVARRILSPNSTEESYRQILEQLPGLPELTRQVLAENSPLNREFKYDGKILSVTASPIITLEQIPGVVLILQDITNRWRLVELQKELVANVSHEFKTPLTSIKGFAELIIDNKIVDPNIVQNSMKIVHSETLRLIRMVNDLLRAARLEVLRLQKVPVNLRQLVEKVVEVLDMRLAEAKVNVNIDASLDATLLLDRDRMEQVFYNLLDNALRFSPENSSIEVTASDLGKYLQVEVRDHGPGIPPGEQEVVFDRFYKVEKARSTNNTGSGLGLAIAKNIITEHGGEIWVNNHTEGGAIFTIQLIK